jgi:elongation factor 1-gamma
LAESSKPEMLGANAWEKAQVRAWTEFAGIEVATQNKALIYPLYGFYEYNKVTADAATVAIKGHFETLNRHLEGKTYLVGSNVTVADVALFNHARFYFQLVLVEDQRKKLYPNFTAWFLNLAGTPQIISTYGRTLLCKVPLKPVKVEKKEEPKKAEPKKEEKKPAQADDDEEKPKKKTANPLDLLPPSTMVLDEFKKEFLNTPDKVGVLANFWNKYDPNGYSFWFMQYQKLASEGKILFKTCNSSSFFLQKLDPFRKYTFSAHGVYGDEGNYEIRGVWMWRGVEIPEEIKEHDNFPFMTIRKLEHTVPEDKALIEQYWLNM